MPTKSISFDSLYPPSSHEVCYWKDFSFLQNYILEVNCRLSAKVLTSKAPKYNKCLCKFFYLGFSICVTPIETKLHYFYPWACFNSIYQIFFLLFYNLKQMRHIHQQKILKITPLKMFSKLEK